MNLSKSILAVTGICLLTSCNETKPINLQSKNQKTYAEISVKEGGKWNDRKYEGGTFKNIESLKVPDNHTDHSFYIRYEGPGWESNKVGYRLYLDWRNAIDIYGKLTDTLVLSKIGLDGFDSYHNMSDWGADILKVAKGMGVGSIGRIVNNNMFHFREVDSTFAKVSNDKEKSEVKVDYFGWKTNNEKTNLQSWLSIFPDQRYTKHTIQSSERIDGICTGIVKLNNIPVIEKLSENKKWGYIATYGTQTLFNDNLGMAVFYEVDTAEKPFEGPHDYLIQFKPSTDKISFYFLGAWEKELGGIKTREEFIQYLDNNLKKLNQSNQLN